MFENEEWRIIQELPHYMVSNYGRVKSTKKENSRALKVYTSDKGFPIVTLYGADSKTRYLRHINQLVATAFLNEPLYENETAVWHIDGNLTNVNVDNLKWETRSRVLEWNEMHRSLTPRLRTPKVRNNRIGVTYENAFECGMQEGRLESDIVWRIEKQARNVEDDAARYRYVFGEEESDERRREENE